MHSRIAVLAAVVFASSLISSCGGGGSSDNPTQPPTATAVATVTITPSDSVLLKPAGSAVLTVAVLGANGSKLTGKTVTWSSSDNSKVTVSPTGQVLAVAVGRATVTATSEGKSGTTLIVVTSSFGRDFAIVGAQFTQGVQDAAGSIPMILSGNPAVVNVLVSSTVGTSSQMQLVLRMVDASGSVVYTDTTLTRGFLVPATSLAAPNAQFLVPASKLAAGLKWQIVRDPKGLAGDDVPSNDVYPATGTQALATATVPPLNIRFVPIVLAANNNSTPQLSDAVIPDYLRTLRSVHPMGVINTHIGASFTTSASFGTPPSGGEMTFWSQVLSDFDLARIADATDATSNWFGIIAPPSGFTFTSFGGVSYIPTNGTTSGPRTRTSLSVRTGWFNNQTQARDLVAHELGHTFGRAHAPCGAAGSPLDASYPVTGGVLDFPGFDVYAWANGLATSGVVVPTSTGDVMGYCFPVWASTYTYKAVLAFRTPVVLASRTDVEPERTRVLVVRGSIDNKQTIKLEPVFTLNAKPTVPDASDAYRVEGVDAGGRVLFVSSFSPAVIDHAPTLQHFAVAVPVGADVENQIAEVRVSGPAGTAKLSRSMPSLASTDLQPVATRRIGSPSATISCGDGVSRGMLILDAVTGEVRGAASAGSAVAMVEGGHRLSVLCSDGLRTRRATISAP